MWITRPDHSESEYEERKKEILVERDKTIYWANEKASAELMWLYLEYHIEVPLSKDLYSKVREG